MNNLEKMIAVGKAVYGDNWQSPISRSLNISDRTIRNFISGKSRIPADMSARLLFAMELELIKIKTAIEIVNSDKMRGEDVSIEMIEEIAQRYEYNDAQDYKSAIDAMNNAIFEVTYLSDLDAVARKFSKKIE